MDKFLEGVLKNDIEGICRIYLEADEREKDDISTILDRLYLLFENGNGDFKGLSEVLRIEYLKMLDKRQRKAQELLGEIGPLEGEDNANLALRDRLLLRDLDTLAEKLEKQAHPNQTGVALLGVISPALAALVPATTEAGERDLAIVTRARARLAELLEGDDGRV